MRWEALQTADHWIGHSTAVLNFQWFCALFGLVPESIQWVPRSEVNQVKGGDSHKVEEGSTADFASLAQKRAANWRASTNDHGELVFAGGRLQNYCFALFAKERSGEMGQRFG